MQCVDDLLVLRVADGTFTPLVALQRFCDGSDSVLRQLVVEEQNLLDGGILFTRDLFLASASLRTFTFASAKRLSQKDQRRPARTGELIARKRELLEHRVVL